MAMVDRLVPGLSDAQAAAVAAALALVPPELRETLAVRVNIKLGNTGVTYRTAQCLPQWPKWLARYGASTERCIESTLSAASWPKRRA